MAGSGTSTVTRRTPSLAMPAGPKRAAQISLVGPDGRRAISSTTAVFPGLRVTRMSLADSKCRKARLFALLSIPKSDNRPLGRVTICYEDRTEAWRVIQSAYAAQLSDRALDWLIHDGVIAEKLPRLKQGFNSRAA
jgi:hypothetical protein